MKTASLGALEKKIMEVIWRRGKTSVRDVLIGLRAEKLAYTTIATIIQRLYNKGLLERKEEGRGYIYFPKLSKESYSKKIAKSFIKSFVHSFGDAAIASFAESIESLPKEKREYFLKLLDMHDTSK